MCLFACKADQKRKSGQKMCLFACKAQQKRQNVKKMAGPKPVGQNCWPPTTACCADYLNLPGSPPPPCQHADPPVKEDVLLWTDSGPTFACLWTDSGPTLDRLWIDFGPTVDPSATVPTRCRPCARDAWQGKVAWISGQNPVNKNQD